MTTMTFDSLAYIDRRKAAGFAEPQARAMADGLDQALREEVATKSDLAAVRNEIGLLRAEFSSEIGLSRAEFKSDLIGIRGELGGLRGEILAGVKAAQIDLLKCAGQASRGQTPVLT